MSGERAKHDSKISWLFTAAATDMRLAMKTLPVNNVLGSSA